ncbi:MAG: protein kinase domain-containing protein [Phycisphaerae bacterium]
MERPFPELVAATFRELRRVPPAEREAHLAALCGDDVRLRDEVLSLLRYDGDDADASTGLGLGLSIGVAPIEELRVEIPRQIGPFEIIDILGSGGTAHVYRARQRKPDRDIALKVLRSDRSTPWIVQRFCREGKLLAKLTHRGIAQVYSTGECVSDGGSSVYLAMELVNGPTLLNFAGEKQLDRRGRVKLLIDACVAVAHAHQVGIIHRDLKPANILVDTSSSEPCVKVLDFGIGRVIPGSGVEATQTEHTSQIIGTIAYMSPERFDVESAVDIRSDIYALGVIGYELLLGRRPHDLDGLPPLRAMKRIADSHPIEPREIDATMDGDLALILAKAVARERADRYESVPALRDDLQAFLEHRPIRARRPSPWYLTKRFVRRNRLLTSVIATGAIGVTASLVAMNFALGESRKSEDRAQRAALDLHATVVEFREEWRQLVRSATDAADTFEDRGQDRLERLHCFEKRYQYLIKRDPGDRSLRDDYALVLARLGEEYADTGDLRNATSCCISAELFFARLRHLNPDRADLYHEHGNVIWRIGEFSAARLEDSRAILPAYQRAHRLFIDAEARWPHSPVALSDLAGSHLRFGILAVQSGDLQEAREKLAAADEIVTRLRIVADQQRTAMRCEAMCDQLRFRIAAAEGSFDLAIESASRWCASTDRLRAAFPSDPLSLEFCMFAAAARGEAAQRRGDCAAAYESIAAAANLAEFLAGALPSNRRFADARLELLVQATDLAARNGRRDLAATHAERFDQLSTELAAREWNSDAHLERVGLLEESLHSTRDCCSTLPTLARPTPTKVRR